MTDKKVVKDGPFIPADSDGCTVLSWVYNKLTGKKLPFRHCCIDHDEAYWYGGTKEQRLVADKKLCDCVRSYGDTKLTKVGFWVLSIIMYWIVRIGGSPKLPTPFRWEIRKEYTTKTMFGGYHK